MKSLFRQRLPFQSAVAFSSDMPSESASYRRACVSGARRPLWLAAAACVVALQPLSGFLTGCGPQSTGEETPVAEKPIKVDSMAVACKQLPTGASEWYFETRISDETGKEDIETAYLEVRDGSSYTLVYESQLEVSPNAVNDPNRMDYYKYEPEISGGLDCIECADYDFKVTATDENGISNSKTFNGEVCGAEFPPQYQYDY